MRCVSYTRTTSCKEDGKIPADIIKQQDQHIQEYLKKQGWTLSAKYCDRKKDTEENTAFEELTKDGIDRKFDMVVVDSIDRCSRTISCADDVLVKTFVPAGIHFAVVQDEFISIGKTKEELYEYIKKARYEAVQLKGMREYAVREQLEGLYTVHDEKYGYILSDDRRKLLIDTEPEEWDVQKDMHTPLVARDDYEELQESREETHKITKKRQSRCMKDRKKYQDSFPGMVRCGECGNVMYFRRYTHNYTTNEKMGSDYYCGNEQCSRNLIEGNLLKILVMDQIQILIKSMCDRKLLLQKMKSATKEKNIFYKAAAKVRTLERKIAQTEERNTRLYEDYVAGIVDKDDFDMMKERYIGELQNLREELQVQEQNQRILEKKANRYMDMVNHMEKYMDKREYNEALVQELVEYVEVYANGSIHVCFKCKDEFQQIAEEMEGVQIG